MIIKRDEYMKKIRPLIGDPLIKVITGMRRVGKSTLLKLIMDELLEQGYPKDHIIEMNFELFSYAEYTVAEKLYKYIKDRIADRNKYFLFLDEIQEVEGFEKAINSLVTEGNVDVYITGSNSKVLSGELATYLTGRFISIEVFPLSFKEMMCANENADRDEMLLQYIRYGGLPSLLRFQDDSLKNDYLSDIYSSILLKDIVKRYSVRDVDLLDRFVKYVMSNIGQVFSAQKVTDFLKSERRSLSRETIYNYIRICESAYMIYSVPRYDLKGKRVLKTSEKYYVNDLGIRGLNFDNERDIAQSLENIVFLELMRRGYEVYVGQLANNEVDFIAKRRDDIRYLQVTYLLADDRVIEREFGNLLKIDDNYPKCVISMDRIRQKRNGIDHVSIIDFLLEE